MALGALYLVYAVLWISVQTENVIEYIYWCFVDVIYVEHLSSIRFRSLQKKLIFYFLGIAYG